MDTSFKPKRRYSAVAVFSDDLERVVLIHKLRPAWQAGKANFPGGKMEDGDWPAGSARDDWYTVNTQDDLATAYRRCAVREVAEETGLVVASEDLKLFCTLRFGDPATGDAAEVQFFCCVGDVDAARTMESETVFSDFVENVLDGKVNLYVSSAETPWVSLPTMSNLPWLTAMARQALQGSKAPPFVVYEASTR